jgi:hypothetical protein
MHTFFERRSDSEPRFIEGSVAELEELFGSPLPELPEAHPLSGESEALLVDIHPGLRTALRKVVEFIYRSLADRHTAGAGDAGSGQLAGGTGTPYNRFENALDAILTAILHQERRLGLLNLFWVAHSRDAAEIIHEFFNQPGIKIHVKYQMHPLLQGVYRNARNRA